MGYGMAGPHYRVRLHIDSSACWHTRVPVDPYEKLPDGEIERRAVANAVKAFGQQASGWTLIDAERRTR
ncbi:hypothetical protein ACWEPC_51730 [Nonomuraea sp. NPDC004297]